MTKPIEDYGMKILDEGCEDKLGEKINSFKKDYREAIKESRNYDANDSNKISPLYKLVMLCLWIMGYRLFISWEFGIVYFMITILVLIFTNLGKRKPWELSAYSVFNPNFEKLPGTLSSEDINPGMAFLNRRNNEDQDLIDGTLANLNDITQTQTVDRNFNTNFEKQKKLIKEKAKQPLNSLCNCESGKKYKNCCAKVEHID